MFNPAAADNISIFGNRPKALHAKELVMLLLSFNIIANQRSDTDISICGGNVVNVSFLLKLTFIIRSYKYKYNS